jgi:hypothetical protein
MVMGHLSECFILEDPSLGFSKSFQIVIAHGDILRSMALMLGFSKLLAMVKDIGDLHPIAIGEVFLRFINHSIVFQLWGSFQEHLFPHQFGISTLGGWEGHPFWHPSPP